MLAQRLHRAGGPLVLEEVKDPEPGGDEVVVDIEACGVGLTVLNGMTGQLGRDPVLPLTPGHEIVGRVTQTGPAVTQLGLGDRVMAYFHLSCGACRACRSGREPLCERHAGLIGVHRDGGYAERVALPAHNCVALPADIDPVQATVIPDAVATSVHVCRTAADVRPGHRVAVIGAGGGVGVHLVQVAQAHGATVTAIDRHPGKLQQLAALTGCGTLLLEADTDPAPVYDVVVDLVGRGPTLRWGLGSLTARGTLVLLTLFAGETLEVFPRDAVLGELTVTGSKYASMPELLVAAELVTSGRVTPVVSQTRPLHQVEDLHAFLREGTLLGRGALVAAGK